MLRKCFGDDFDAKGTVAKIAFTKDFTVCIHTNISVPYLNKSFFARALSLIYQVNLMNNYKATGKIAPEFKWDLLLNYQNLMKNQ